MTRTTRSLAALVALGLLPCGALVRASSDALAGARAATARYHDVAAAEADGYIDIGFCEPGEGCHYLNPALVDGVFDAEHPEILLYVPNGEGMRLVAVEYVIPLGLAATAPEGFTGDADVWREDAEGAGLWELTVWIWMHNPAGMFEQHNPRLQ